MNENKSSALFFSAVGAGAQPQVVKYLDAFAGCRILLASYDGADIEGVPRRLFFSHERGRGKYQYAYDALTPTFIESLGIEWVFLWDDDLDIVSFDPSGFIDIMRRNDLSVAQPGIISDHGFAWDVTRRQDGILVGRRTNFVEIMAPCYSAAAWLKLRSMIGPFPSFAALGYDFASLGACGIIDRYCVRHLRPVNKKSRDARGERDNWMRHQKVDWVHPAELGSLF